VNGFSRLYGEGARCGWPFETHRVIGSSQGPYGDPRRRPRDIKSLAQHYTVDANHPPYSGRRTLACGASGYGGPSPCASHLRHTKFHRERARTAECRICRWRIRSFILPARREWLFVRNAARRTVRGNQRHRLNQRQQHIDAFAFGKARAGLRLRQQRQMNELLQAPRIRKVLRACVLLQTGRRFFHGWLDSEFKEISTWPDRHMRWSW